MSEEDYDDSIFALFDTLLESKDEKEIMKLILENKSSEDIVELLLGYRRNKK
ncbi:MAG: hypothetical protein PHC66_01545 [Candidatus Nanoarchaeia archaeon]|nr:hypothetical protein [Candidatus Nanoarchaeia archaeon]MDD5239157.1 hypothetical protein [Candidatus Nanoarchaeia archaeon]